MFSQHDPFFLLYQFLCFNSIAGQYCMTTVDSVYVLLYVPLTDILHTLFSLFSSVNAILCTLALCQALDFNT